MLGDLALVGTRATVCKAVNFARFCSLWNDTVSRIAYGRTCGGNLIPPAIYRSSDRPTG